MAIEKLKRHRAPGIDQIPAEVIKAGGSAICSDIHKTINSILNKEELPEQRKESINVPIYKGDKTDFKLSRHIFLSTTHKILSSVKLNSTFR